MNTFYVTFAFLGLLLITRSQATCPSRCSCFGNAVSCAQKSLPKIPNFDTIPNTPDVINLAGNNIDFVNADDFSFEKAESVSVLYLNKSKIIDMDDISFIELINLKELYLGDNILTELPRKIFRTNDKLTILDLSGNRFRIMPKIKSKSLEMVMLVNAGIAEVSNDVLADLPSLRALFLQRNNIKSMDPNIFKTLPRLLYTKLNFNPWQCNCQTVNMLDYLYTKKLVDLEESIQCLTEDRFFIDIYNSNGPTGQISENCISLQVRKEISDDENGYKMYKNILAGINKQEEKNPVHKVTINVHQEIHNTSNQTVTNGNLTCYHTPREKHGSNYLNIVIPFLLVLISFVCGVAFGVHISLRRVKYQRSVPKDNVAYGICYTELQRKFDI